MKKRALIAILMATIITLGNINIVQASSINIDTIISPLAEKTTWKYKYIGGVLHKRLFSITYNKWKSNWIRVDD